MNGDISSSGTYYNSQTEHRFEGDISASGDLYVDEIYARYASDDIGWNISTGSNATMDFVQSSSLAFKGGTGEIFPRDIHFKPDGTKLFMVGTNKDTIYEYSTGDYISYKSVGTGLDGGIGSGSYTVNFNSTTFINSKEYSLKIGKRDFNFTTNPTVRRFGTVFGSAASSSLLSSPHIKDDILSSSLSGSWGPSMTTVGFYRQYTDGTMDTRPVMVARYPQPIMIRKDIDLILKIRIDI